MARTGSAIVGLGIVALAACGGSESAAPVVANVARPGTPATPAATGIAARIPRAPGDFGPSLVAVAARTTKGDVSDGAMLSDVDSCASCHPAAAAQWSSSAHSFASFGNPIYRFDVEQVRADLGKPASRHCGGCHDMPLMTDGLMTAGAIPPADLRSHSGVTCRLCHGVRGSTNDGNGSYVWDPTPLDAPVLGDAASIARHKAQVTTFKAKPASELCVACHRGFVSPDMGVPVHLSGLEEAGFWRSSAFNGNGMARIDKVEAKTCTDCHMEREAVGADELGAKHGTIASHRFVGGHTWMAAMRGDDDHLRRTRAKLEGAASIDIAGARSGGAWHLPADGAPVVPGQRLEFDVVTRSLLVGHRFPGGVLDIQDTWVEVEVTDRLGRRLASSGLAHATDRDDDDAHVLRTIVVDENGAPLREHEMAKFRAQIATQTIGPREAQAVRYAFDVPPRLDAAQLPLAVTARLRHRSRSLAMQAATCKEAQTDAGKAFIAGARGARSVALDPCKPQPITLVAETRIEIGAGARPTTRRPAWERMYEHGMALVAVLSERQDEPRAVLERALAAAPDARARAMVTIQLAWVAGKQGRVADAVALAARARELLALPPGAASPPVLDAVVVDAYARATRWAEAVAPAKACTERAPQNAQAWSIYARVLGGIGDHPAELAAATHGLELAPRDPDLLRSQFEALSAMRRPEAAAAQAAYDRFRGNERWGTLRIACSKGSERCARERKPVYTIALR